MTKETTEDYLKRCNKAPELLYELSPDLIIVDPTRQRKFFDEDQLHALANSISQIGQLQAGLCIEKNQEFHLIAGERRLRACKLLGRSFKFILTTLEASAEIEQAQLEENLKRIDLSWQEEVTAKKKLYDLFKSRNNSTSIRSFAAYLGEAKSLFHEDLQLASWISEIPEVSAAENKTLAKKIVKRLSETVKRKDKLDTLEEEVETKTKAKKKNEETGEETGKETGESKDSQSLSELEEDFKYFNSHCIHSTFDQVAAQLAPGVFNIVFFDPPWGVNYAQAREAKEGHKHYDDSEDLFDLQFPKWATQLYNLMSPDSHLYCFFPIAKFEFVYSSLETAGFQTNKIPLIWHKIGQHATRNPYIWYGRAYEPIAFARKGKKDLLRPGVSNIITTSKAPKVLSSVHPTAKHPDIYARLLQFSAEPGDKIFDPMSGTGACALAAELMRKELKLEWLMVEQENEFHILQKSLLAEGYYKILRREAKKAAETGQGEPKEVETQEVEPKEKDSKEVETHD